MKQSMYLSILTTLLLCSCGSDPQDDPAPVPTPQYETVITVGSLPDSVKVGTSTEVRFTVTQQTHPEDFKIAVDTVVPYYFKNMSLVYGTIGSSTDGYFWKGENKSIGQADITINGKDLQSLASVPAGKENIISFSNPTAVGTYKIVLSITDKQNRKTQKEIELKAWSPEITIKFYQKNIGFEEDKYYETLNQKYTYSPLSSELKGRRVDTIYTQEIPMHGRPGEWTVPGQCIICYIGQEGGEGIQTLEATGSFLLKEGKILSSTTWSNRVDGKAGGFEARQGFHGIMFETSTLTGVGSQYYTIRVVDKWGKEKMATIVYKAFGRDEAIPAHCTPSENMWWAHYIAD